jgi:putative transposase
VPKTKRKSKQIKHLRDLVSNLGEQENARLRRLLVQRDLEIDVMKEIAAKKW